MNNAPEGFPDSPECQKLSAKCMHHEVITDFLEHLDTSEFQIYRIDQESRVPIPLQGGPRERFVLQYLGVDPEKLEMERRAILKYQRRLFG